MEGFLYFVSVVIQVAMLIIGGYYTVISLVGCLFRKEPKATNTTNKTHKFALVVSAHNEEVVIGNLVDSMKNINLTVQIFNMTVKSNNN